MSALGPFALFSPQASHFRSAPMNSPQGGLSRRRNPPFTYAKKAGYAFGYNPPHALHRPVPDTCSSNEV